jgi:hypothetical protein
VREVVFVGLMAGAFAKGEAEAGAVVLRLVTIVAELLVLVGSGGWHRPDRDETG